MLPTTFKDLFNRYLTANLSTAELLRLRDYIMDEEHTAVLDRLLREAYANKNLADPGDIDPDIIFRKLMEKARSIAPPRHRVKMPGWIFYAVAAALITFIITININDIKKVYPKTAVQVSTAAQTVLILGSGRSISLDNTHEGIIAEEDGITITAMNGVLHYKGTTSDNKVPVHTIITPTGGAYTIMLADGSLVRLNARSSLRFPAGFSSDSRNVELTGEGYFDVQHQPEIPFNVKVRDMQVKVLGTRFNIMGYGDEKVIKTTVTAGAVKISAFNESVVIKAGHQAVFQSDNKRISISAITTNNALAWTNGQFRFDAEPLDMVMREIARWYNVEVIFQDDVSDVKLSGLLSRKQPLKELLETLEMTRKVHFHLVGNKVIVSDFQ